MQNKRYDYLPLVSRKPIEWPNRARVAFWVCPNIEYFHFDKSIPGGFAGPRLPDIRGYCIRDYGSRIGVFRMMDILDEYGIRASVLLNSDVCKWQPEIIKEGNRRKWEWLGHGITNNLRLIDYPLEGERAIIREVKETIAAATGSAPKGWLSPGLEETLNTPDLLAAEGFEYLCDWGFDDQPIPMRVKSGKLISVPYSPSVNDLSAFLRQNHSPDEYVRTVCDHFDVLYEEGARNGRVMSLPLHPFVIGLPYRIKYLNKVLEYICAHNDVWLTTGGEIAAWYYQHYYEDPGAVDF